MAKQVKLEELRGMLNSKAKKPLENPDAILNMDVIEGKLKKRKGFTQVVALTDCKSLYSVGKGLFLCKATSGGNPSLLEVDAGGATQVLATTPGDSPLYYVDIGDRILISSPLWRGSYNKATRLIGTWGVNLPSEGPTVSANANGFLPPGTYRICFTRKDSTGEISGNSTITTVELTAEGGITVSNRASDYIVWCTEPSGDLFYLVGAADEISGPLGGQTLPTEGAAPPDNLKHLVLFLSRVWGVQGKKVLYSDPYSYGWFHSFEMFESLEDINGLAWDDSGIYVFTESLTVYLQGDSIDSLVYREVGDGLIEGTISYFESPENKKKFPVWASKTGIFQGEFGSIKRLNHPELKPKFFGTGASFSLQTGNELPQIGVSAPLPEGATVSDNVEAKVIRGGRVVRHTYNEFVRDSIESTDVNLTA